MKTFWLISCLFIQCCWSAFLIKKKTNVVPDRYVVLRKASTWSNAKATCKKLKGSLLNDDCSEANNWLKKQGKKMWVEGSLDSAVWRLENGDELSSFGRNILKPKQCLASENGKLISLDCGLKLDFACQVTTPQEDYDPTIIPGRAVKTYATKKTWAEAEKFCQKYGGHQITVNNKDVQAYVTLAAVKFVGVWIGFSDKDKEKTWRWASGKSSKYLNWRKNEPNQSGNEDCASSQKQQPSEKGQDGKWNDVACSTPRAFML